ncbi:MAG TPA: hypothetical protein VHY36_17150 [Steroidobacteraceae bacterium]|jgi:hypothetical protein|nr:hypothetical protein [Steroidobacteraceae bacterium]
MSQEQQQRQRQQEKQRQKEDSRQGSASQQRTADQIATQVPDSANRKRSAMKIEEARVTEGKDGVRNLQIQWIDVRLPNADSCRFAITTREGNAIEALMEQKNYRRSYQGTSSLQTDIVSVAPNGTQGKLTVRDLVTGETIERPWTWHAGAGGLWAALWGLLKRLLT